MHYQFLASTIAIYVSVASAGSSSPSATLDAGVVIGTTTAIPSSSTNVNKFLGIPFAAPPIRFSPPQKPKSWFKPLSAQTFKPACIQQFSCKPIACLLTQPASEPRANLI
jgi:carboxylesterase type B